MARSTQPIAVRSFANRKRHARDVAVPASAPRTHLAATGDGEVRIGPVAAIPALLRKFGVTPSLPFARAGVPLHAFTDPENRIAFDALGRLLAECSAAPSTEPQPSNGVSGGATPEDLIASFMALRAGSWSSSCQASNRC